MRDFNVEDHPRSIQYRLMRFMDTFGNVFFLNIFFVLFSIPIVTIGASITAMYHVMFELQDGTESYIYKMFFEAFKSNFKQRETSI